MKINKLLLDNFKGQNGEVPLDRLNVLVGANGTGKSARLQAIWWAIEGASRLGRAPRAALPYAGPNGMRVGLKLDNGLKFDRTLFIEHRRNRPPNVKCCVDWSGADTTTTAAETHVRETVGDFAPMFDLGVFLDKSIEKRTQAVVALCAGAVTSDGESVANRIILEWFKIKLGAGTVAEMTEQPGPAPLSNLVKKLSEDECAALDRCQTLMQVTGSAVHVIEGATEEIKKLIAESKRAKDEARQASNELSARHRALQVPAGTADELRAKRDGLAKRQDDLSRQIGLQLGRATAHASLVRQKEQATARVDSLRDQRVHADDYAETLRTEADAQRLEDEAIDIDARIPEEADVSALQEAAQAAVKTLGRAEADTGVVEKEANTMHLNYLAAGRLLESAEGSPWTRLSLLLDNLHEVLPPAAEDAFSLICDLVAEQSDDIPKLKQTTATAYSAKEQAEANLANSRSALEVARTAREKADAELEKGRANNHARNQQMLQRNDLMHEAAVVRNMLTQHAENVDRINGDLATAENTRLALERQINDLTDDAGVPVEQLKQQRDGLAEAILQVDASLEAMSTAKGVAQQLAECLAKKGRETVTYDVAKGVAEAIKVVREEYMAELVAPLVDKLNAVLGRLGGARTAHCKLLDLRGQPAFDLGWSDGKTEVSLDAMSGGEQVLFSVCLLYALVMLADPPLKLLMIEAGELDGDRLDDLLCAIHTLTDGPVGASGNVLVATCRPPRRAPGWNVIELPRPQFDEPTNEDLDNLKRTCERELDKLPGEVLDALA
jgi:exonuclease SbcC